MIWKYSLFSLMALFLITASDPYFGRDSLWDTVPKELPGDVKELSWRSSDRFKFYLQDQDNRVADAFTVGSYYYPMVQFWFLIYTQFENSQVVIHDKNNMSLIYKVLDFTSLHEKGIPKNTIYILQKKISDDKLSELKEELDYLTKNPLSMDPRAKAIYRSLGYSGTIIPSEPEERKLFFSSLRDNLRTQTGQKNFIRDGILRAQPYQNFLGNVFKNKNLPIELLAIPFLESSFNPRAHSKVSALGAWQFMPLIASYFLPKRTNSIDYRSNVGISTLSASFLMEENFRILKSWDLAVTAYNSGPKHLLKTKRELASEKISLEDVIKNSDSKHFGFASKNFYSEFLALTHTLAYKEELFSDLHEHDRADVNHELNFYILKCPMRLDKTLSESQLDDLVFYNNHLKDINKIMPRGLIITVKSELPSSKFYKVSEKSLLKTKPKDWLRSMNQSCSTK